MMCRPDEQSEEKDEKFSPRYPVYYFESIEKNGQFEDKSDKEIKKQGL